VLTCANCETQNEPGRKFCVECGDRLAAPCAVCGIINPVGAKFCGECGNALTAGDAGNSAAGGHVRVADANLQLAHQPVAERRLVSVLFADLVGFTTASEGRDAEDTREILTRYFDAARQIVDRHGGVIEKFIGDAVMAVWGTPTAHEDDAERAVRTALELLAAVGGLEAGDQSLQARAGVLTGEAAVTIGATGQGMVAGDLVNTASRLQSVAVPGAVLVGEATYRAASGAIAFEEVGEQELKGKEAPVRAWRAVAVVARRGGQGRAAALEPPFVGRDEELRALKDQFHATARQGKPRLVTIVGQAGIGKSRLGWELEKYLDGVVETVLWHEGRSPSYGEGISYWALAEIVRGRAGIAESEDADSARAKLAEALSAIVQDPVERGWIEPRLTGLLGLDELPNEGREELFAAWRTFFERLAQQQTVLLVFWDLQWADQGLLDFIEHLLAWARSSPIFVLAEARPELLERRPGWGSNVRSATSIHLEPLSDHEMSELLSGLVPGLPDHALRAIVQRAEGVPLYAVETIRMLIDRGALRPDGSRYALAGELPELAVPDTLHALIAARLDALEHEDRALITDAAVLGLSFALPALHALTDLSWDEVAEHLDRLVRHELLVLDADPRSPERGQYRFLQGVVREVAYQSLAKRDRRAKHLAAARYFESLGEDELAGVLASHYVSAHRAASPGLEANALAAQARVALRAAAERASSLHSEQAAQGYLESALEVTDDPGERATLHERAAGAAWQADRMTAALDHARAAEEIHAGQGDRLGVLRARTLQATTYLASHADRPAVSLLRSALEEVADLPPSAESVSAQAELARALMLSGDPEAIDWADRVLGSLQVVTPKIIVETLITKGSALQTRRAMLEAEVVMRGALAVAERVGDVSAGLRARNNLRVLVDWSSFEEALILAREGYEIGRRFGLSTWVLQNVGVGLVDSRQTGAWDDWLDEMRAEMGDASEWYSGWFRAEEAWRLAYRGHPEQAEAIYSEVIELEVVKNSRQALSAFAVLLGDIRMAQGRWLEAYEAVKETVGDTDAWKGGRPMLAAMAVGDPERLNVLRRALPEPTPTDPRFLVGLRDMDATFDTLLRGQWDEALAPYSSARSALVAVGAGDTLARFQLAVGHAGKGRFSEADEAAEQAARFFAERGGNAYVETYRASAWSAGPMGPARRSPKRAAVRAQAEAEPSGR